MPAAVKKRPRRPAARRLARGLPRALALEARRERRGARRSPRARLRGRLLAVARRRRRSASSCRVRAVDVTEEGILGAVTDCLFCKLVARRRPRPQRATASSRSRTSTRGPTTHLLVIPERHVETFRDIGEFPRRRRSGCSSSSPTRRARSGSRTIASSSTSAPAAGRRSSTCTGTCSAGRCEDCRMSLIAESRRSSTRRCGSATPRGATRCG